VTNIASLVHGCVATDKPELNCMAEWSGQLGQTDYEITCSGRMNPEPLQVVWKWNLASTDRQIEIFNEVINHNDLAEVGGFSIWCLQNKLHV